MRFTLFAFILFVSFVARSQDGGVLEMSLEDCIEYAKSNNESLKIAQFDSQISEAQVNETLAQGLPQINGEIGFTHNLQVQTSFIEDFISPAIYGVLLDENLLADNAEIPPVQTFPARFGTKFTGQAGVGASQLLFDGSYFIGVRAAKAVKDLSVKQAQRTEIEVVSNVSKAYYLILVTQENMELLGKNYARIDSVLKETQLLYENGFAEKIDVSRIKIQHNNLRNSLSDTRDQLVIAANLLKFQMGMPLEQRVRPTGELADMQMEPVVVDMEGFDFDSRVEYQIIQKNKELIGLNIKNFQSQYLPNLYASFDLGWTSGTQTFGDLTQFNDQTWFRYTNWGLRMNIPIFDGFRKRNIIQQNRLNLGQLETNLDQTRNNIKQDIRTSSINLNNALTDLEYQRENMELADEVYEVSRIKYSEGVGSNLEVVEADTSLKEAQTNYYNALYEAIIAKIDLDKALGNLN